MGLITLSVTSKLDGIRSWSLEAGATCPGAKDASGRYVDACRGCYARSGHYAMPSVKNRRAFNRQDWQRRGWVADMVATLETDRYFRWFDSGDMYSLPLAKKILAVMTATPWCKHWLPTRMHKFPKFAKVIAQMQALPNVMVRCSSDSVLGAFTPGVHGSTIIASLKAAPDGVKPCLAYLHGGQCSGCRACWDKSVPVVGYVGHGATMIVIQRSVARQTQT